MVSLKILTLLSYPDSNWSPLESYLFYHPNRKIRFLDVSAEGELIKVRIAHHPPPPPPRKKGTYNKKYKRKTSVNLAPAHRNSPDFLFGSEDTLDVGEQDVIEMAHTQQKFTQVPPRPGNRTSNVSFVIILNVAESTLVKFIQTCPWWKSS